MLSVCTWGRQGVRSCGETGLSRAHSRHQCHCLPPSSMHEPFSFCLCAIRPMSGTALGLPQLFRLEGFPPARLSPAFPPLPVGPSGNTFRLDPFAWVSEAQSQPPPGTETNVREAAGSPCPRGSFLTQSSAVGGEGGQNGGRHSEPIQPRRRGRGPGGDRVLVLTSAPSFSDPLDVEAPEEGTKESQLGSGRLSLLPAHPSPASSDGENRLFYPHPRSRLLMLERGEGRETIGCLL